VTKRDPVDFAADHALMEWQREERKATGRPLRTGDLVQAKVGGPIREIVEHEGGGDYVARMAMRRPSGGFEGSTSGRCALYGGNAQDKE
jgi:hypothetical protein